MTITEMLGQSGLLTLLGMGVVFSFIIILILSMKLLNVLVHAFKLDKEKASETKNSSSVSQGVASSAVPSASDNEQIIAAIAAAVHDRQLMG